MMLAKHRIPHPLEFRPAHPHFIPIIRRVAPACIRLPQRLHPHAHLFPVLLQIVPRQHALDLHVVGLLERIPLLQHPRRQRPIIGQKHQSRRRILQIPHGIDPLRKPTQQIPQRLPSFWIRHRRHHLGRFVHQQINLPLLVCLNRPPHRHNLVFFRVGLRPQLRHHLPVHRHLSGKDQLLGMPPRSNPRPRNYLLQPFLHLAVYGPPFEAGRSPGDADLLIGFILFPSSVFFLSLCFMEPNLHLKHTKSVFSIFSRLFSVLTRRPLSFSPTEAVGLHPIGRSASLPLSPALHVPETLPPRPTVPSHAQSSQPS